MGVSFSSNISSLRAQRSVRVATDSMVQSAERLASGLRINRPSDDAAGLAIASNLNFNSRVFGKAIQNLNDGISAISVAEGATSQLSMIVTRLKELSEQSASGTLGRTQRLSIDTEGQALRKEFNRIIDTTTFNGIRLINESTGSIRLEAGSTLSNGGIVLNSSNLRTGGRGTGTFQNSVLYDGGTTTSGSDLAVGDVNDDGFLDEVLVSNAATISIMLGNGDGTFKSARTYASAGALTVELADTNGDGRLDIIAGTATGFKIHLSNGDGTIANGASYTASGAGTVNQLRIGDFNGDGMKDVVLGFSATSRFDLFLGSGNGTFKSPFSVSIGSTGPLTVGDVNGDGKDDLAVGSGASGKVSMFLGSSSGINSSWSFQIDSGAYLPSLALAIADFNGDGQMDVAAAMSTGEIGISLGNGNGTFKSSVINSVTMTAGTIGHLTTGDINGDGRTDLLAGAMAGFGGSNSEAYISGANGTFASTVALQSTWGPMSLNDLNGDGALDLSTVDSELTAGSSPFYIQMGNVTDTSYLQSLDLTTRSGSLAAIRMLETAHSNLLKGVGMIGAERSRISIALNVLGISRESFIGAESRIKDIDVAEESSTYVKNQIAQQLAASILAQANQQPALALKLLES